MTDAPVNVRAFGAKGDGVADDTAAIQAAIDAGPGEIHFPPGVYATSAPLRLRSNRRLVGAGAGEYRQGAAIDRISTIRPKASFSGTDIVRADPADFNTDAYVTGISVSDLTLDLYDVRSGSKIALHLASASNCETFSNLRIINQDNGHYLRIRQSTNAGALESDGLRFDNLYTLSNAIDPVNTDAGVYITESNEITFRASKIQRRSSGTLAANSIGVLMESNATKPVNDVLFDNTFIGGYETGAYARSAAGSGQGPRWIRFIAPSFETVKYCVRTLGLVGAPVQMCSVVLPRQQTTVNGGRLVLFGAYTYNCRAILDEYSGFVFGGGTALLAELTANTSGNWIDAQPVQVTDAGTDNVIFGREAGLFSIAKLKVTGSVTLPSEAYTDGAISFKDGVTAPGSTAGVAKLYVDSADGDLKVKFGDGTVKTIVVDT
jgi:hypothetical protein